MTVDSSSTVQTTVNRVFLLSSPVNTRIMRSRLIAQQKDVANFSESCSLENVKTTTAFNGFNEKLQHIGDIMNAFQMIDNNKIATAKQVYGVACHFANIHAASPSERYGLTKVFNAILNKFYGDQDSYMTHGEVTDFREHQVVPAKFLKLVKKPKASKKVKAKAKPKSQSIGDAIKAVDSRKPKATAKKSTAENSVAKQMNDRITTLETKVSGVDSKLNAILAILSDHDGFSL